MKQARLFVLLQLLVLTVYAQQAKVGGSSAVGGQTGTQQSAVPQLKITTSSLPAGTANVAYTATLTAVNGITPYNWSIMFGSLPPGLTLNSATGTISGTPSVVGNFPLTVLVTDSTTPTAQNATATLSIQITCPTLSITTTSPLPPGTKGSSYSAQFLSLGGSGAVTWTNPGGGIPTGTSLNSAGLLSGTPTVAGAFSFNITATDSCPTAQAVTQPFALQINSPVTITTTSPLPPATEGVAYQTAMAASGGTTPYVWSLLSGTFPSGVSISSAGVISGTPTAAGTFTPKIQVTDNGGTTNNGVFSLTVSCVALSITSTSPLPNGTQGSAYSAQMQSSGGTGAVTWITTGGSLPPGLVLSSSGAITGTPTTPGSYSATIQAKDSCSPTPQTVSGNFAITIGGALSITTTSPLPQATVGQPYSTQMSAQGGVPPYQWALIADSFPQQLYLDHGIELTWTQSTCAGLTGNTIFRSLSQNLGYLPLYSSPFPIVSYMDAQIVSGTTYFYQVNAICNGSPSPLSNVAQATLGTNFPGTIQGTPTQTATTNPTIQVTDSVGNKASAGFTITSVCTPLSILTTSPLPQATINQAYSQQFTSFGGAAPISWAVISGALPTGITMSSTGLLAGTPTVTGTFNFVVQAVDSCLPQQQSQQQSYTLAVTSGGGPLTITTTSPLPNATEAVPYSTQLQATGGTPPYSWTETGALPTGLNMTTAGVISGTPTVATTKTITAFVTDAVAASKNATVSITVFCPAFSLTSTSPLPNATVGQAYSFTFTSQGGISPISWSATGIPAGLSLSTAGVLSGTPTSSGASTINVTVADSCAPIPQSQSGGFSLTVNAAVPPLQITTTSPLPGATEGTAYSAQLAATGGVTPYAWSITTGVLPPGLSLATGGLISGTPSSAETDTPTFKVLDSVGTSQTAVLSITSSCPAFAITSTSPLPNATQNSAYSFQFSSSGGIAPITWTATGVPVGLTLSTTGLLSGTPTGSGTFTLAITAKDSCAPTNQQINQSFSLTVSAAIVPLSITTTSPLPPGTQNTAYSTTMAATGGTPPYTWSVTVGSLPTGLSLAGATGIISGTPTVAQTASITIQVTDNVAATKTGVFSITINAVTGADNRYCSSNETVVGLTQDGPATPLQGCVYTALSGTPSPGPTHTVCASGCDYTSLASALTAAACGWTITIKATSSGTPSGTQNTYTAGTITLPAKSCNKSNWITIESDLATNANFPAEGTRITPAWVGQTSLPGRPTYAQPAVAGVYLPKLISTGNNSVMNCASGANFYRIIGLEFTSQPASKVGQLVDCSAGPVDHIIFDRVLSHASNSSTWQSIDNLAGNFRFPQGTHIALIDSYVGDSHCVSVTGNCIESKNIGLGGNEATSSGPSKLVNNFLETAGEPYFAGGGGLGPGFTTMPAQDIEIRRNHMFKPLYWKVNDPTYFGTQFVVKNNGEFKNAQRALIEGNIFENTWGGQSDQFGDMVLFGAKNQSASTTGTASSNGTGTLTASKGTFSNLTVSQYCAVPFHCIVKYAGAEYSIQTWVDSTHITVSPNPPTNTGASFRAYTPGLNPNAVVKNVTFRYNYLTKSSRGFQLSAILSDGNDSSLGTSQLSIHDNVVDGLDGVHWNLSLNGCCVWSIPFEFTNVNPNPNQLHDITIRHNTLISFLSAGGTVGYGPSLGYGFQQNVNAAFTNLKVYDNISASGLKFGTNACVTGPVVGVLAILQCWDKLNGVAQNSFCFDHNVFATTTATTGAVTGTANNGPFPGAGQSPGCPFTSTGNAFPASYDAIQFTSLNAGTGGNYLLQVGSPYHNTASDGTDPGANINLVNTYTAGVQ